MIPIIDIETTGLDYRDHSIMEIAILAVTDELVVVNDITRTFFRDKNIYRRLGPVDQVVIDMHDKSGLWEDCDRTVYQAVEEIESDLIKFIDNHGLEGQPMCGSSIHFDRGFIKSYMPVLESKFHYRNIDVSSIKNLAERWNPEVFTNCPTGKKLHRALPDCYDTLEELKYYRDNFLIVS